MLLNGKTAIVTGGNSGIGEAICHALAKAGAAVVVAGRRQKQNERVAADLTQKHGRKALPFEADVAVEKDCDRLIAETIAAFGRLDILVNNAGIYVEDRIADCSTADFDRVLKTNLYGAFWCARAAFRQMQRQSTGFIINISSIAGVESWSKEGPYSVSKYGVMALTQALADEGKPHNIKCAAICPALVATPMTGLSGPEYILPEDISETVIYLLKLSPAAWVTEIVVPRKGAE